MEQWQPLVTKLKGGFTYLENRLTNNCDSPYHLKVQHEATKLLRAFDPSLASGLVDTNYVDVIRYMCTACAWEASGAVSGKFREISAPAAPLANFSLNFAKLLQTPRLYAHEAGDHMGSTSGRQVELLVEDVELTAPWRGAVR
jgi:hypothetical protein